MNEVKVAAIDVDGALLNSQKQLTRGVKNTVLMARKAGIKIVIATGRPLSGVKQTLHKLDSANQNDEYVVCFGGGVVETTSGSVLFEKKLTYDNYLDLETIVLRLGLYFHAPAPDRVYIADRDTGDLILYEANLANLGISYRTPTEMKGVSIIKCMRVDEQKYLDKKIVDRTPFAHLDDKVTFIKTAPFYYEANPKGVSKGNALKIPCQKLNLTNENIVVIGDEESDLSTIKYAGTGAVMRNAVTSVKDNAQIVMKDCDHDGVAAAIEKVLQEKQKALGIDFPKAFCTFSDA